MNNEITIDPIEIAKLPDNSISDSETIRQIALYSIKHHDNSLNCKIQKGFEFAGLYPHVMEDLSKDYIMTSNGMLNNLYNQRKKFKSLIQDENQIVSFDFDNTLDKTQVQRLVKRHLAFGDMVYIVTTRRDKIFDNEMNFIGYVENTDLYEMAEKLMIPKENVRFTSYELKLKTLIEIGSSVHFDDDVIEIDDINRNGQGKIAGILIDYKL